MKWIYCPYCHAWKYVNVGTSGTGSYTCTHCMMVVTYWNVWRSGKLKVITKDNYDIQF